MAEEGLANMFENILRRKITRWPSIIDTYLVYNLDFSPEDFELNTKPDTDGWMKQAVLKETIPYLGNLPFFEGTEAELTIKFTGSHNLESEHLGELLQATLKGDKIAGGCEISIAFHITNPRRILYEYAHNAGKGDTRRWGDELFLSRYLRWYFENESGNQ